MYVISLCANAVLNYIFHHGPTTTIFQAVWSMTRLYHGEGVIWVLVFESEGLAP